MGKRIWTIGYEGHSPESLTMKLREAGVERVVDVRELPLSRKAGFSKSALALGLSHAGIAYTHLRALGTPRAVRHAYAASRAPGRAGARAEDAAFAQFRRAYLAHLAQHEDAIEELEALARAQRCALLCVEAEHDICHRGVLAETLAGRGWRATHL